MSIWKKPGVSQNSSSLRLNPHVCIKKIKIEVLLKKKYRPNGDSYPQVRLSVFPDIDKEVAESQSGVLKRLDSAMFRAIRNKDILIR
ncbi:hypothetical protein BpHYR1_042615 [Brachionus plicatilis]|uniref:Uncharacterized protein n=1 Tax=Brachionus plicatilis TaxID=10195 RepID=A0A3M7QNK8_BRAPC|nr:hypothetical protein BpHYR1_042615 [Brachionus plicatilis]